MCVWGGVTQSSTHGCTHNNLCWGLLAMQVDSEQLGQTSKMPADSPTASELGPEQAQFVASRSPSAQQFVRLILERWSDKRHGMDWLLLPEGPPSKYLLALLALHSFDTRTPVCGWAGGQACAVGGAWVLMVDGGGGKGRGPDGR